eukprot:10744823-Alexandrium_andersonii.AAC.1
MSARPRVEVRCSPRCRLASRSVSASRVCGRQLGRYLARSRVPVVAEAATGMLLKAATLNVAA